MSSPNGTSFRSCNFLQANRITPRVWKGAARHIICHVLPEWDLIQKLQLSSGESDHSTCLERCCSPHHLSCPPRMGPHSEVATFFRRIGSLHVFGKVLRNGFRHHQYGAFLRPGVGRAWLGRRPPGPAPRRVSLWTTGVTVGFHVLGRPFQAFFLGNRTPQCLTMPIWGVLTWEQKGRYQCVGLIWRPIATCPNGPTNRGFSFGFPLNYQPAVWGPSKDTLGRAVRAFVCFVSSASEARGIACFPGLTSLISAVAGFRKPCVCVAKSRNGSTLKQGSLKDTFCPFEAWLFFHQNKGTPPFTRQCSGV